MKYCMHCGKELRCYVTAEGGSLYNTCFECHEKIEEVGCYVSKEWKNKVFKHINTHDIKKLIGR